MTWTIVTWRPRALPRSDRPPSSGRPRPDRPRRSRHRRRCECGHYTAMLPVNGLFCCRPPRETFAVINSDKSGIAKHVWPIAGRTCRCEATFFPRDE